MQSPNRSLADVSPSKALLWCNFSTQFDVNSVRCCENLGRAPGAPRLLTMGAGSGASMPTQLAGRHGISLNGAQYVDTGIIDPFERTDRFTLFAYASAVTTGGDLISSGDDAQNIRGIVLTASGTQYGYLINTDASNILSLRSVSVYNTVESKSYALTYGGSSANAAVYLKGSVATITTADTLSATVKSGKPFLIGARHNGVNKSERIVGVVHNAMIFPWELTAQQVQYLHRYCLTNINAA